MLHAETINRSKTILAKRSMLKCINCSSYKCNCLHIAMHLYVNAAGEWPRVRRENGPECGERMAQSAAREILNNF